MNSLSGISGIQSILTPIWEEKKPKQIASLSEISLPQPKNTFFLFDIDDTLFDSPWMLGTKGWRSYITKVTQEIDSTQNWHDILSYTLAQKYPVQAVETVTSSFIKQLQEKYMVCGFTSRERNAWYDMQKKGIDHLTVTQLHSVGIDFNHQCLEKICPDLLKTSEYFQGIFFANLEPKGKYLSYLLENKHHPEKIVFIDDKETQVKSVAKTLTELRIQHECYIYSATDEKVKNFNPLIANIQLYSYLNGNKIISDQQAQLISMESHEKKAEDYLKSALALVSH